MKTIVILAGPQGSGNHLFSKIFALHPLVYGWKELLGQYWIGHDHEPFAKMWVEPELIRQFDWSISNFYVTSISYPYINNGVKAIPDFERVINEFKAAGLNVKLVIIGRDQNILRAQEQRVRNEVTVDSFLEVVPSLLNYNPIFVSTELLFLYENEYIKSLQQQLQFPIAWGKQTIHDILENDPNSKYITTIIEAQSLDQQVKIASIAR